jgi:hypothetical protein
MPGYAPPSGSAVAFNFSNGVGGYTPPAGNLVAFDFNNNTGYSVTLDAGSYVSTGAAIAPRYNRIFNFFSTLINDDCSTTAGWTVVGPGASISSSGGQISILSAPGSYVYAYQAFTASPGKRYRLRTKMDFGPGATGFPAIMVGTAQGVGDIAYEWRSIGLPATVDITFTAPAGYTTLYVQMAVNVPVIVFGGPPTTRSAKYDYVTLDEAGALYAVTGSDFALTRNRHAYFNVGTYTESFATGTVLAHRLIAPTPGSYAISGSAIFPRYNRLLAPTPGTYAQTGAAISLKVSRYIAPTPGVYTVTGHISALYNRLVRVAAGAYALAGSTLFPRFNRRVSPAPATYIIDGKSTFFDYHEILKFQPDPGVYALTGGTFSFTYNRRIAPAPGTYTLQGHAPDVPAGRRVTFDPGSYGLSGVGIGATITVGPIVSINAARYTSTWASVQLTIGRRVTFDAGSYTQAGTAFSLKVARSVGIAPGAYQIAQTPWAGLVGRALSLQAGAYTLTGTPIRAVRNYAVLLTGSYSLTGTPPTFLAVRQMNFPTGAHHLTLTDAELVPAWRTRGPRAIACGIAASRHLAVAPQSRRVAVEPQNRRLAVAPASRRYAAVAPLEHAL